jgi:hypothetical protein
MYGSIWLHDPNLYQSSRRIKGGQHYIRRENWSKRCSRFTTTSNLGKCDFATLKRRLTRPPCLFGKSSLLGSRSRGETLWCRPCEANRFIATGAANAGMGAFGRLPVVTIKGGAKLPLAAAWAGADARCPVRSQGGCAPETTRALAAAGRLRRRTQQPAFTRLGANERIVDLAPRLRRTECDTKGKAAVSVADSGGSRPRTRDDVAHHSDLISLGVPR